MKVALLGHTKGNIGHALMVAGMKRIISHAFPNVEFHVFEQHNPFCVFSDGGIWSKFRREIVQLEIAFPKRWYMQKVLDGKANELVSWLRQYSGAILCGGPNIAPGVSSSINMKLMCHMMPAAFASADVPVLDLAVGSCYPLTAIPERMNSADEAFHVLEGKFLTGASVRDDIAQKLMATCGRTVSKIPCGAIASGLYFQDVMKEQPRGDSILINYQKKGANEDWGQGVSVAQYREVIRDLIKRLQRRHKVAILCQNEHEYKEAAELDKACERVFPKTVEEYASAVWKAKSGVVSRIHAAIPMAGIGVPTVAVGTDSRLGALKLMGLKTFFAKEAVAEELEASVENLLTHQQQERERLTEVQRATIAAYSQLLRIHIKE
jgi:polysaccharide pyruvyl transferase WcaK-like protein